MGLCKKQTQSFQSKGKQPNTSKLHCFRYNNNNGNCPRQNCPFLHKCQKYGNPHSKKQCPSNPPLLTQTREALNNLALQHLNPPHKSLIVAPLKVSKLTQWLDGYDANVAQFVINGFEFGFKIPYFGSRCFQKTRNLKSALDYLPVLHQKIQIEIDAGRVVGPFQEPPFPNCQVSPLGLVPKKSGDFRIIQHLSAPEGSSVNDGIPKEFCSVQYQNIDHAVALFKGLVETAYFQSATLNRRLK